MDNIRQHLLAMGVTAALAASVGTITGRNAGAPTAANAIEADTTTVTADSLLELTPLFDRLFLDAVCQRNAGNDSLAAELLQRCAQINPNAAEVYFIQSAMYAAQGSDSLALALMERAKELQPGNDTYAESVADTYLQRGDYDKAITAIEDFYSRHHDRTDQLNMLLALYIHRKQYDKALNTIDRMDKADGTSEDKEQIRMQIYDRLGDTRKFYDTLLGLVKMHPYEPNYKVMMGNWLVRQNRKKEAYLFLDEALQLDPESSFALTSMCDYYNATGNTAAVDSLHQKILYSPKTEADLRQKMLVDFILSSRTRADLDSATVLGVIDHTMEAAPHDADISNLKAAYMEKLGMPTDSVNGVYRHTLAIAPDNMQARIRLIQNVWPKWSEVEALAKEGTQYCPEAAVFYYFLGNAYFQTDRPQLALATMRAGVAAGQSEKSPNADLLSDMYAMMGDILYAQQQYDEAFASYDSCMQWKDDNLTALNNCAYYMSEQGRDLNRAAAMSRKTVEAEPTNTTFLDTYAWILYMLGRYDEAKAYIDRALECDTDSVPSAVVVEHAGDIYLKTGDSAHAAELWQKAIDCGGDKATLTRKIKLAGGKASE